MKKEISQPVHDGTLNPIGDLASLKDDDQEDFNEGFVMSNIPDMMTRSHATLNARDYPNRCPRILARAEHSQYLVFPTAFSFPKVVRIISIIYKSLLLYATAYHR